MRKAPGLTPNGATRRDFLFEPLLSLRMTDTTHFFRSLSLIRMTFLCRKTGMTPITEES